MTAEPMTHPEQSVESNETVLARLRASARQAHDHRVAMEAEHERRDLLIVECFDRKLETHQIAGAAELSTTRLFRILGKRG